MPTEHKIPLFTAMIIDGQFAIESHDPMHAFDITKYATIEKWMIDMREQLKFYKSLTQTEDSI